ncbi:hypothetical protein [Kistimonas scapharcae]
MSGTTRRSKNNNKKNKNKKIDRTNKKNNCGQVDYFAGCFFVMLPEAGSR